VPLAVANDIKGCYLSLRRVSVQRWT